MRSSARLFLKVPRCLTVFKFLLRCFIKKVDELRGSQCE
jgi:hypothetical protein